MAFVHFYYHWDWEKAKESFERSLEYNPNDVKVLTQYSFFNSCLGNHERAVNLARKAASLDPLSSNANTQLGQALLFSRRYDEAIAQLNKTLELNPRYLFALGQLGYTEFARGNQKEMLKQWSKFFEYYGNKDLARIFSGEDFQEVMRKWIEQLKSPTGPVVGTAEIRAWPEALLGHKEEALKWLRSGIRKRTSCVLMLKEAPWWDFFRQEQEFQNLIQLMGFPEDKSAPSSQPTAASQEPKK
jgi:tetratricopeptide (TPR) repeat protein